MKKKFVTFVLSAVMACGCLGGLTACSKADTQSEAIDATRTQLYVYNYNGGYGAEWLNQAKKRFEEYHKDDSYEEGKTGVQIIIDNKKDEANTVAQSIAYSKNEVYFAEKATYTTMIPNVEDISEAVKGEKADLHEYNGGDAAGTTIFDKMTAEQQAFYTIEDESGEHIYGVPHYMGVTGFTYNVGVFDKYGFYFKKDYVKPGSDGPDSLNMTHAALVAELNNVNEGMFVTPGSDDERTLGPDGKTGTENGIDYSLDDGLPATYKEFLWLCRYIADSNVTPMVWSGADYLRGTLNCFTADFEGVEQMALNYNIGTVAGKNLAKTLGRVDAAGNFVKDETPTEIKTDGSNAKELRRQEGKFKALQFMRELVSQENSFIYHEYAFNTSRLDYLGAQDEFIRGGTDNKKEIAMLNEGIWWQSEATNTFDNMVSSKGSDEWSKQNRDLRFMPLPKADSAKVAEAAASGVKQTLFDHIYSLIFVKKGLSETKKQLAFDFVKFCNTDQSLVEFTQITGTPKALKYTMTDEQMAEMTPFGRSVMNLVMGSEVLYPVSDSKYFFDNQTSLESRNMYNSTVSNQNVISYFHENAGATAKEWFEGMYNK